MEKPLRLALLTGVAFFVAGLLPIIPFLLLPISAAVLTSVAVTAIGLFLAGILRAVVSLAPLVRSGTEMVLVGMGAAALTYVLGRSLGIVLD